MGNKRKKKPQAFTPFQGKTGKDPGVYLDTAGDENSSDSGESLDGFYSEKEYQKSVMFRKGGGLDLDGL